MKDGPYCYERKGGCALRSETILYEEDNLRVRIFYLLSGVAASYEIAKRFYS